MELLVLGWQLASTSAKWDCQSWHSPLSGRVNLDWTHLLQPLSFGLQLYYCMLRACRDLLGRCLVQCLTQTKGFLLPGPRVPFLALSL